MMAISLLISSKKVSSDRPFFFFFKKSFEKILMANNLSVVRSLHRRTYHLKMLIAILVSVLTNEQKRKEETYLAITSRA